MLHRPQTHSFSHTRKRINTLYVWQYEGDIKVLYQATVTPTLTNKKWGSKDLPVKAGDTLDVIVRATGDRLICRNEEGKCAWESTAGSNCGWGQGWTFHFISYQFCFSTYSRLRSNQPHCHGVSTLQDLLWNACWVYCSTSVRNICFSFIGMVTFMTTLEMVHF